jgi:2-C-methyl-D-erythritol 4-phosphate cytidylyltransferase / 2-C-methyl-D-erythritol 2,4-cyclodiphosphate synthase
MSSIAVLIVAAGQGERAGGGVPKQFRQLGSWPLLRWSVEAFSSHPAISAVHVVIGSDQHAHYERATRSVALPPPIVGGERRQDSVRNGLEALAMHGPDYVLIHDAARPLASRRLIDGVIAALITGADAAVPMMPVADTLRRRNDDGTWDVVPRARLHRAQTPQGFHFIKILEAHRAHADASVTDDMAIAELAGLAIVATSGEESNLKVTEPEDFAIAEKLLSPNREEPRTGMGFDVHKFVSGDHIWLCGVRVPHDHGLEGHSDADAGLHALTDAILGAIGAGDIGQHFPPSDERWRNAKSSVFLAHAASLVRAQGGRIAHCDVTLICESPRIGPHREAMRARIAEILGIDVARVSVKATTTEGLGYTGRREGIAAQAVATITI